MANRQKLEKEIKEYCSLNNISDSAGFITQCMLKGFTIFKYGVSPIDNVKRERNEIETVPVNRKPKEQKKEEKVVVEKPKEEEVKSELVNIIPELEDKPQPEEKKETNNNIKVKKRRVKIINND